MPTAYCVECHKVIPRDRARCGTCPHPPWVKRYGEYRLMVLAKSGRRSCRYSGALVYLFRLMAGVRAYQAKYGRRSIVGRCWIELSTEPAFLGR